MENKVAVITGAGSGLGKALAISFSKKGYGLVLSGRNLKKLESVKKELDKKTNCISVEGDITKKEVREKLLEETLKKYGKVDALVNNAGILLEKPLEQTSEEEIEKTMEINAISHIKIAKAFYDQMKKQKSGTIVNIVSINAISTRENISIYAASKGAMKSFTDTLRFEANKHNISVVGVYPGGMKTDLFKNAGVQRDLSKMVDPKEIAEIVASIVDTQKDSTSDIIFYRKKF